MAYKVLNSASALLTAALGNNPSTDTTAYVSALDGAEFAVGTDHSYLVLEDASLNREIVKITGQSGGALTIVRAQDGTTIRAWNIGDIIECRPCQAAINDIFTDAGTVAAGLVAAHTGDASAAHAASAISYAGATGLSATDVEAALDELDAEKTTLTLAQQSEQAQSATAFTTTGTSAAYLLTPTPAISANTAGLRFRVAFHTPPIGTPTMAVSGQTALPLKYKDSSGTKQTITSTQVPANWAADVETDGTDWVVVDIAPYRTGSGSGLDADTVDGVHAAALVNVDSGVSGIGMFATCNVNASVSSGATCAGSNLGGSTQGYALSLSGTWRNISGRTATPSLIEGIPFQRIA